MGIQNGSEADIRTNTIIVLPSEIKSQPSPMRRAARKFLCKLAHIYAVTSFEGFFPDLVLLSMMYPAQADRPAIRRLQPNSTVGLPVHVRTLNG